MISKIVRLFAPYTLLSLLFMPFSSVAVADDTGRVTLSLSGYVKPVCGFVGDAEMSVDIGIDDLAGAVSFDAPISCNTPFDYAIHTTSAALASEVRAQSGFQSDIPYVLAVDFGGAGGAETFGDCAARPCEGVAESSTGARLTFRIPDAARLASGRTPLIAASYAASVTIQISARL